MIQDGERPAGRTSGSGQEGGGSPNCPLSPLDTAPYRVGRVALVVRDLDGLARFYRDTLGLATVSRTSDVVRLGIGAAILIELRHDPAAEPVSPQRAGLFHTAFLLPSRGDLGAWLAHAAERSVALSGAADHLVSEAVYLSDPEGNGIEIYVDRPRSAWPLAEGGGVVMRNDRLDHAGLLRAAPAPYRGMPAGSRVGHVHLQVGALDAAERFYADLLGFDVMCRYPGATFLGAGGYHHQLATNVWNSRGAARRHAGMAGVAEVVLLTDPRTLAAVRARGQDGGWALTEADGSTILDDPWGIRFRLVPDAPMSP